MSSIGNDVQLLLAIKHGDIGGVKAVLEAGAAVDGAPEQPLPPIVAATIAEDVGIVEVLLGQGADPDRPVNEELSCTCSATAAAAPGERALHIAARGGNVEIVRLLLGRSRADPNATDNRGCTPLMASCDSPLVLEEVVRLLLEAGADPALADEEGFIPLHLVARDGHVDLVDVLHSRPPTSVNDCASYGQTPLFLACSNGHESMVSKLLSLGAMEPTPLVGPEQNPLAVAVGEGIVADTSTFPLTIAAMKGFVGVVRVLINEGGIRPVGREIALTNPLYASVRGRQATTLLVLLTANGEERRSELANVNLKGSRLLHCGAGYCYPAAVSILLEAGADEAVRDSEGRTPRDIIGVDLDRQGVQMNRGEEVAIRRMLQRGPAYRARSWAWPSDEEADGAGGSGDGDAAASAAAAVLSPPPTVKTPPNTGVRIFRPKEKSSSSSRLFVRLIGRYCAKD